MALLTKQVDYCKELDDVGALLVALVRDIRAGKAITELAADLVPKLVEAVNGVDSVPVEIRDNLDVALQTLGYRVGELAAALFGDGVHPL